MCLELPGGGYLPLGGTSSCEECALAAARRHALSLEEGPGKVLQAPGTRVVLFPLTPGACEGPERHG